MHGGVNFFVLNTLRGYIGGALYLTSSLLLSKESPTPWVMDRDSNPGPTVTGTVPVLYPAEGSYPTLHPLLRNSLIYCGYVAHY
jgi:hypothetical protein